MKKIITIIVMVFLYTTCIAQKVIEIGKKHIITQTVDSMTFDLRGTWKFVDQKWYFDDGEANLKEWNKLNEGNPLIISDSIFYGYTNTFICNLIKNPIFMKYMITKSDNNEWPLSFNASFFEKQFNDTALYIAVWSKADLERNQKRFENLFDAVPTNLIYVLNNNYIAIDRNNSLRYYERISIPTGNEGWKKEMDYNVIYLGDDSDEIRIIIPEYKNRVGKHLEYIYIPHKNCNNGRFRIYNENALEGERVESKQCIIDDINTKNEIIKGHIPFSMLQSNIISIFQGDGQYHRKCPDDNAGKFLWKIVPDTKK